METEMRETILRRLPKYARVQLIADVTFTDPITTVTHELKAGSMGLKLTGPTKIDVDRMRVKIIGDKTHYRWWNIRLSKLTCQKIEHIKKLTNEN